MNQKGINSYEIHMKKVSSNSKRVSKSYIFFLKKNRIENVSIHMKNVLKHMKKVSNHIKKVSNNIKKVSNHMK
jgi:hypothetical protein